MVRATALTILSLLSATPALGEDFEWHDRANQKEMNVQFANAATICVHEFGFRPAAATAESAMLDKMDAFLLLRTDPDAEAEKWVVEIVGPIFDMTNRKSSASTREDDHRGGAALLAAAEDPGAYAEAERQFLDSAMRPIRTALAACSMGADDPFLGKYYWTGTGTEGQFEADFKKDFPKMVAAAKAPPSTNGQRSKRTGRAGRKQSGG